MVTKYSFIYLHVPLMAVSGWGDINVDGDDRYVKRAVGLRVGSGFRGLRCPVPEVEGLGFW